MKKILSLLFALLLVFNLCGCVYDDVNTSSEMVIGSIEDVPKFGGLPYVSVNDGKPEFTENEITTQSYEKYSALDYLGRCGVAMACLGKDLMPTEERGEIGMVKPTGWHTVKYDFIDGKYLYNRCHLIGFQLSGENANEQNLITGTRFLNIEGMLPFENMIADYIKETDNHVMYRVTPIFEGINLLCKGVQIEGYSVEDNGEGICFNVFAYNAQPQVEINYLTGENAAINQMIADESTNSIFESSTSSTENSSAYSNASALVNSDEKEIGYVLNTNSKKIHLESCIHAVRIKEENKKSFKGNINKYIDLGYTQCQTCMKDK